MATVYYVGNARKTAQVDTILVTAVAVGGTLTATIITGRDVTYTCVTGDTTATAAAGLLALLTSQNVPPEFAEYTWALSGSTITGTASTPGTLIGPLTKSQAGGATCTLTHLVANTSPSDVGDANNWLRGGVAGLPQNSDVVILQNCDVPLLWNLDALVAVQFASFTRWQSHTGQVGLPDQNQAGYIEYRPTHFAFVGSVAPMPMILGYGAGARTALERYTLGAQRTALTVLAGAQVDFLGTSALTTASIINATTVNIAAGPAEVSALASATVDGGGNLVLGAGVTFSGALTVSQGSATVRCAPASILASNGARVTVGGTGLTYPAVTASLNSVMTWLSDSNITALTLQTGSILDKSQDIRAMTIAASIIDGDSCRVLDPMSAIVWSTGTIVRGQVTQGPFTFLGQRTVKIT